MRVMKFNAKVFQSVVEHSTNSVIVTDLKGKVIYANVASLSITGYQIKELLNKNISDIWGNLMEENFYLKVWQTVKDGRVFKGQLICRKKNKDEYQADISFIPLFDDNKKLSGFAQIARDATREKDIDQAKTEFVSLASHQLRTPLSAIKWYTEMLLNGDAGRINKKQKRYLKQVYQ